MKAKATATLRMKTSGEVIGEIADENDEVVSSRHFGVMTEDDFREYLKLIEKIFLEVRQSA
jgi:hypothetical protein